MKNTELNSSTATAGQNDAEKMVEVIYYHGGDDIRTRTYRASSVQEWNGTESVKIAGQWFKIAPAAPAGQNSGKLQFGYFDGLRGLGIEMTIGQALSCSHQGSCDSDVAAMLKRPEIAFQFDTLGAEVIRDGLRESGAWDSEELQDDEQNRARALWMAACDIRENPELVG